VFSDGVHGRQPLLSVDKLCFNYLFQVWRLMRKKHRRPNTIHYNLLLRAIRDCAVGSEEHIRELLLPQNQSVSRKKVRFSRVLERKRPVSKKSLHVSSDSRLSFPVTSAFCFKFSQLRCFFLYHLLLVDCHFRHTATCFVKLPSTCFTVAHPVSRIALHGKGMTGTPPIPW